MSFYLLKPHKNYFRDGLNIYFSREILSASAGSLPYRNTLSLKFSSLLQPPNHIALTPLQMQASIKRWSQDIFLLILEVWEGQLQRELFCSSLEMDDSHSFASYLNRSLLSTSWALSSVNCSAMLLNESWLLNLHASLCSLRTFALNPSYWVLGSSVCALCCVRCNQIGGFLESLLHLLYPRTRVSHCTSKQTFRFSLLVAVF